MNTQCFLENMGKPPRLIRARRSNRTCFAQFRIEERQGSRITPWADLKAKVLVDAEEVRFILLTEARDGPFLGLCNDDASDWR